MKSYLKLLAISCGVLLSSGAAAQQTSRDSIYFQPKLKKPITPPAHSSKSDSAFWYHLPLAGQRSVRIIDSRPLGFRSNMPVLKPEKNSQILIGKIDPDFPYQYKMPVLAPEGLPE